MTKKSVCVFCGARSGNNPTYLDAATRLGRLIAQMDWRLVYGAGDVGLMGAVANAAQAGGADTFGVIPQHLVDWEVGKTDLTRYIVTETMHERKKVMVMNSDAFVLLPGGAGSLDEFFEVLTWRQLGLHAKPIFILNLDGYWDSLEALLDHVVRKDFANETLHGYYEILHTVEEVAQKLRNLLSS